jgi:sphinganine-1-phosphate aldolase
MVLVYVISEIYLNFSLKNVFRYFMRIGFIKRFLDQKIESKLQKVKTDLIKDRFKDVNISHQMEVMNRRSTLQNESMQESDIFERISRVITYNKQEYKISGAIYVDESKWRDMVGKIYADTAWLNPTHGSVWPELTQLEAETYSMCSNLFRLDGSDAVLTVGGTMSNIQAIYTYREKCSIECGITRPNIVAPNTAHTSFKKACQILGIEYKMCEVDKLTGKADLTDMRRLIDSNTICLVGSAPSFPYGIIDPIRGISDLAIEFKVGFHLDCCLGGFQVPFTDLSEQCDFRVEGITSISADPHKFGQSPKGISILMFRSHDIKKYLTFVDLNWSGGLYVVPDFSGSRAGSNIVILWAILKSIGLNGFTDSAQKLIKFRATLCKDIDEKFSNHVSVFGEPELSTFGIKSISRSINIHILNNQMTKRGWEFNSLPDGMHFCLTEKHHVFKDKFMTDFMTDLDNSITYILEHPDEDSGSQARIYCSSQEVPNFADDVLDEIGRTYVQIQTMVRP